MTQATVGKTAPDFTAAASGDSEITLSALRGKTVVLYFYPKDSTPGCTQEGQDFRDRHAEFAGHGAVILGVSRDSVKKHDNFKAKHGFPFELIADPDNAVCDLYGVFKEKNMYGRKVMGIERSTFLVDADGVLREEWRKVRVKGHVDQVLDAVAALAG